MGLPVSALLLAAGSSTRMGQTKQLLPLGHKPVIIHCIDALVEAGIGEIAVVISSCRNGLAEHLRGLPVLVAVNENPGSDMAESVRSGLHRLQSFSSAVLVCLCDHPLVTPETIRNLVREHGRFPGDIIIPEFQGKRGHPSLFPRHLLDEIFSAKTLRDIVREYPSRVRLVPVRDEGVVLDMDEPRDYTAILKRYLSK
jgi:CTP:molybdopterin cytidylyltransferase MocA